MKKKGLGQIGRALAGLALVAAIGVAAGTARAEDDPDYLSLGVGAFDVLHNFTAGEGRIEYRFHNKLWIFKPYVGIEGTTDRAFYGFGGFLVDIYLSPRWVLTPNEAVGYYHQGGGKVLGATTEFRSGFELAYRFDDRSRLGATFHHISNAGIGKKNPGEEEAALVYSIPLNLFK